MPKRAGFIDNLGNCQLPEICSDSCLFAYYVIACVYLHLFQRRKIFGPKMDEVTGEWIKLHNEELNEMGGPCSTYGGEERCIQGFGWEPRGKEPTWKIQA